MRRELLDEPTLAARLRAEPAPPLLAPLVAPPLAPADAEGLDLILEGFLAHHASPRQLDETGDGVLAGDFCYAAGLVRVARAGDVSVIAALAELVALSAGLVAEDRRRLLGPLWRGVAASVADPDRPRARVELDAALAALRDGDERALAALAARLGQVPALDAALA